MVAQGNFLEVAVDLLPAVGERIAIGIGGIGREAERRIDRDVKTVDVLDRHLGVFVLHRNDVSTVRDIVRLLVVEHLNVRTDVEIGIVDELDILARNTNPGVRHDCTSTTGFKSRGGAPVFVHVGIVIGVLGIDGGTVVPGVRSGK